MLLRAVHGFCIGGGVNVAAEQVFESANDSLSQQWIASGAAVVSTTPLPNRDDPVPVPITMDNVDDASGEVVTASAPVTTSPSGGKKKG